MVVPSSTEGELDKHQLTCSALLLDPMPHSDANPEGIGTVGMHRSVTDGPVRRRLEHSEVEVEVRSVGHQ